MSLQPKSVSEVPAETARVARAAFRKGKPYLRLRDEFGALFTDQDFVQLYPSRGQPALSTGQLALVTLVQLMENLTDRQMADQVRARIDLKGCVALTCRAACGGQGWPDPQATPAATADHIWNVCFWLFLGQNGRPSWSEQRG